MRKRTGKTFQLFLTGVVVLFLCSCAMLRFDPVARFEVSPVVVYVGETVMFDGSSSYSQNAIVSYSWEFGDGESTYGQQTTHTYVEPGRYLIALEVGDAAGRTGRVAEEVAVYLRSGSEVFFEDFSNGTQALEVWSLDPTWASAQEGTIVNLGGSHGFVLDVDSGIDRWHRRTVTVKVPPLHTGQRLAFSCQVMTTHTQDAHTFFVFPARRSLDSLAESLPYFVFTSEGGGSLIREPDDVGGEVGHLLSFRPSVYRWYTYTFVFSSEEYSFFVNDDLQVSAMISAPLSEGGEWLILLGDESHEEACHAYFDDIRMWIEE